jgi:hypothetical protein
MPLAALAPTAGTFLAVSTVSNSVALPTIGSPTTVLVTNTSEHAVFVALCAAGVVAVAPVSLPVMPGQRKFKAITVRRVHRLPPPHPLCRRPARAW